MSKRHSEAFRAIRREHDAVVRAVLAQGLDEAVVSIRDAYCLLLIAQAERFLRERAASRALPISSRTGLGGLVDIVYRDLHRNGPSRIRSADYNALHDLRESRNEFAHGVRQNVFLGVPVVEATLARFFGPIP